MAAFNPLLNNNGSKSSFTSSQKVRNRFTKIDVKKGNYSGNYADTVKECDEEVAAQYIKPKTINRRQRIQSAKIHKSPGFLKLRKAASPSSNSRETFKNYGKMDRIL